MPAAGSVTYAAPATTMMQGAGSVVYAAAPSATMMPAGGSVTYGAPMQTMTYGAPAMTYEAPMSGQPVYTISPERFQRIMAGEPLTNEEIAAMTGAPQPGESVAMPAA